MSQEYASRLWEACRRITFETEYSYYRKRANTDLKKYLLFANSRGSWATANVLFFIMKAKGVNNGMEKDMLFEILLSTRVRHIEQPVE